MRSHRGHANTWAKKAVGILKKYKLAPGDRTRVRRHPNGNCAICGEYSEKLIYDHCHRTNYIRDQICKSCNSSVGWAESSQERFEWAQIKTPKIHAYIVYWDKHIRENKW